MGWVERSYTFMAVISINGFLVRGTSHVGTPIVRFSF